MVYFSQKAKKAYNPVSVDWQRKVCQQLGLQYVHTTPGGPDVKLKHPASVYNIKGDGNCLFHALSYIITGSEKEHILLRRLITEYMKSTAECSSLLDNYIEGEYATIDEYIKDVKMDTAGMWGTTAEMLTLAYMLGVNTVS